jgi:transposase
MDPPPLRYFELIRQMKNPFDYRLCLVDYARQDGIKAAARAFQTTVPTVRKWLRRYRAPGLKGLQELSRAPPHGPHKIQGERERLVVALRQQLPPFGAARLRREGDLPLSAMAIQRIWHEHGLVKPRRRKDQRKQDLAALKATWRLGQQISADPKDLDDIPPYGPQRQARGLPLIQYTARAVRSGLQFLAFAQHRSPGASALFAYRLQSHLAAWGLDLRNLVWPTDNGGEFIGALQPDGSRSGFPRAVTFFGSQHARIPPAAHPFQRDVETVHRLIEDEFYDLETFRSRRDFLAQACVYQLYFNLVRPNAHKGELSPWQIIQQLDPRLPLKLCLLPPVFLDYRLDSRGGYDLPRYP